MRKCLKDSRHMHVHGNGVVTFVDESLGFCGIGDLQVIVLFNG